MRLKIIADVAFVEDITVLADFVEHKTHPLTFLKKKKKKKKKKEITGIIL
jgi:hypothetical protein